jgi:acetyltransferase-like isoleucine patch superfamily enzyme
MKKLKVSIRDVSFGEDVTVIEPVNLYRCEIGSNSFIGPFTEIQNGVTIGENVRIQSHSFLCEGVTIGSNSFIGHGVMFINDTFSNGGPARGDQSQYGKTTIEQNVSIGSNSTILPVRIISGTVIGAGSVVTKDINSPGVYAGNPAIKIK